MTHPGGTGVVLAHHPGSARCRTAQARAGAAQAGAHAAQAGAHAAQAGARAAQARAKTMTPRHISSLVPSPQTTYRDGSVLSWGNCLRRVAS